MKFTKTVKAAIAGAVLIAVGFVGGLSSTPQANLPVQKVALETTPGPYGSGVLGDWSGLSHGLYCFPAQGSAAKASSYTKAAKATQAKSSAAFDCPGETLRIYGDSITFGAKSALASEYVLRGQTVYIDAWSGRPTTPIADAICAETDFPANVIVASGTNDIFNPTVMTAQINRIKACIAAASPTTKLFWEDVQATRWGQTDVIERNDQRNSMAVNLAIYQNIPTNRVIQWTQRFMSNPALLTNYLADGIHPKTTPLVEGHSYSTSYAYYAAIQRGWLDTLGGI